MLAASAPNDAATCAAKLARSLVVAAAFCKDPTRSSLPYVPFREQNAVGPEERVFRVDDGLFVASEHGASDVGLLRGLGISRVINMTGGLTTRSSRRANWGERVPGWDVAYVNISDLDDKPHTTAAQLEGALERTRELLAQWAAEGRTALVHCSAGLCRSASMVMALLMRRGASFGGAMAAFRALRGRPAMLNNAFGAALWHVERAQAAAAGRPLPAPTYDFTAEAVESLSFEAGGKVSLNLAPAAEVAARLRGLQWDGCALFTALIGERYDGHPKPAEFAAAHAAGLAAAEAAAQAGFADPRPPCPVAGCGFAAARVGAPPEGDRGDGVHCSAHGKKTAAAAAAGGAP